MVGEAEGRVEWIDMMVEARCLGGLAGMTSPAVSLTRTRTVVLPSGGWTSAEVRLYLVHSIRSPFGIPTDQDTSQSLSYTSQCFRGWDSVSHMDLGAKVRTGVLET